jgi:hypothetical protein
LTVESQHVHIRRRQSYTSTLGGKGGSTLRKIVATLAVAGVMAVASVGAAFAASDNHAAPGTPGTPNCVGQTNAYLAQFGTSEGIHGIGNVADASGLTVQEVQAIVQGYCAGP